MVSDRWRSCVLPTGSAAFVVVLLAVALLPSSATAEARRFAIVVGANHGDGQDQPLLYAERDAERMASVMRRLGQVKPENLLLLKDVQSRDVERALLSVSSRIAEEPTHESLLVVYYSGHADNNSLHLSGTRLPFTRLKALLGESPANIKVLVIDACRSGEITRVKGATPTEPFKIDAESKLAGEGMAIITSAAAGEDAQESERLKGSFFTHHLIAGLLGAADTSRDRRVTLTEVYRYAYNETLRSTSRAPVLQHPTYFFNIRGREDLTLTSIDKRSRGFGRLVLEKGGAYVLFEGSDKGPVVAEIAVEDGQELALKEGHYVVRRRGARAVYEGAVDITEDGETTLTEGSMERVPYGRMVRKGLGTDTGPAIGVSAGVALSNEIIAGTGELLLGTAALQVDFEPVSLALSFRYGETSSTNDVLSLHQRVVGANLSLMKMFDLADFALGFGVRGGGDWIQQEFSSLGVAPSRSAFVWSSGALVRATWSPWSWMAVYLDGGGDAQFTSIAAEASTESELHTEFVPWAAAGLTFYLP